jgi:hypothetical protein
MKKKRPQPAVHGRSVALPTAAVSRPDGARGGRRIALGTAVGVAALLVVLGYHYLYPGSQLLLDGESLYVVTDGGDSVSQPVLYWMTLEAWLRDPARLFYGTVFTEMLNAPDGWGMWHPWLERFVALLGTTLAPLEIVPMFVVWVILVLNGLALYAFGRVEGWSRPIAIALAVAFAFSAYTRARAVVHPGLVALYGLPLIFIALRLVQRARRPRDLLLPAAALFASATISHYYILMVTAVTPLLYWFFLRGVPAGSRVRGTLRLLAAATPAVLLIGYSLVFTLPPYARSNDAEHRPPIRSDWIEDFRARPIDYVTGDLAGVRPPRDWNPLRLQLTKQVLKDVRGSNAHERTNGIRWILLATFAALAVAAVIPSARRALPAASRREVTFFLVFAVCMALLAAPPAARAVHLLLPNFRVPCRYGAFAHFGVLAAVGWGLHLWLDRLGVWRRRLGRWVAAIALPAVVIADHPPQNPLPFRRHEPSLEALARSAPGEECGTGLIFPFRHGVRSAQPVSRQIRTTCRSLTTTYENPAATLLAERLSHQAQRVRGARAVEDDLVAVARCMRLDWIAFERVIPEASRARVCAALGGQPVGEDGCRLPGPVNDIVRVTECVPPAGGP